MTSNNDYQSMASFILKWRWEPDRCAITAEEVQRIKPLSSARANEVWKCSSQFVDGTRNDFRPSSDLFLFIAEIDVRDKNVEEVQEWLAAHAKQETKEIIVSWQPDVAVLTDWSIFLKLWNDFCYPASDDVSIWPVSEKWLLHYWHEGVFYFAT